MKIQHLVIIFSTLIIICSIILYKMIIVQLPLNNKKIVVVCTTTIIGDTIQKIAGDTIHLDILMGPGIDPHIYKPIEQDVFKISQADLILYHGLHLEARMADLFKRMNTMKPTFAVTKDIPTKLLIKVPEHEQCFDPHIWFDPTLWIYVINTITNILQLYIPKHAQLYEHNKQKFIEQVKYTYATTQKQINTININKRILITCHDAFSYFARAYNFKVISLQGINTASEASALDITSTIDTIIKNNIPTIFIESSIPIRNMQAIEQGVKAQGLSIQIGKELFSDALGDINSPEGTYLGMLTWNINSIIAGLI